MKVELYTVIPKGSEDALLIYEEDGDRSIIAELRVSAGEFWAKLSRALGEKLEEPQVKEGG